MSLESSFFGEGHGVYDLSWSLDVGRAMDINQQLWTEDICTHFTITHVTEKRQVTQVHRVFFHNVGQPRQTASSRHTALLQQKLYIWINNTVKSMHSPQKSDINKI